MYFTRPHANVFTRPHANVLFQSSAGDERAVGDEQLFRCGIGCQDSLQIQRDEGEES